MLMSLAGIVFGVGFFIVTQAQTTGFENFFIRTILGTEGAVRVQDRLVDTLRAMAVRDEDTDTEIFISHADAATVIDGLEDTSRLIEGVKEFPQVIAVSEVLRGQAVMRTASRIRSIQPYGIVIDDHIGATNIANQIRLGDLQDFRNTPNGLLIGRTLATRMDVAPGDTVIIEAMGQTLRYRISAIFETGVREIDLNRVFIHLSEARSLLRRPSGSSFLIVNIENPEDAPDLSRHMMSVLNHHVVSWQEREAVWIEVFRALRVSSAITVSTIILISGLGMFNTLVMIVMEKNREIAILRSMGYSRSDISRIFLWQGGIVLFLGTLLGWLFGALVTWGVSRLPIRITGIFTADSFIVNWDFNHYLAAAVVAVVVVMTASYFPARRAARLEPGSVIRGSSS